MPIFVIHTLLLRNSLLFSQIPFFYQEMTNNFANFFEQAENEWRRQTSNQKKTAIAQRKIQFQTSSGS